MAGAGMAATLGAICREARREAGLRLLDIAMTAGVSQSTVSLFENAQDGWRRETDRIVAAYEQEAGLPERELWRRAIRRQEGGDE